MNGAWHALKTHGPERARAASALLIAIIHILKTWTCSDAARSLSCSLRPGQAAARKLSHDGCSYLLQWRKYASVKTRFENSARRLIFAKRWHCLEPMFGRVSIPANSSSGEARLLLPSPAFCES